jgi:hypothetical protein
MFYHPTKEDIKVTKLLFAIIKVVASSVARKEDNSFFYPILYSAYLQKKTLPFAF